MTTQYERQELRILMLKPIRHLPPYAADYTVACRVGKAMAAHVCREPWNAGMQKSLEASLSRSNSSVFHAEAPPQKYVDKNPRTILTA
jgi:hypothetical protein